MGGGWRHSSLFYYTIAFLRGGPGPGGYYYPIMIQFIFLFPIVYFIIKQKGKQGLYICFGMNAIYDILANIYSMNEGCYRLLVFRYILVIAVGCYIAIGKESIRKRTIVICFILGVTFIVATCYGGYNPLVIKYWPKTSFIACLYIIPIIWYCINHGGGLKFSPLELLGKASYNIFLVQMVWYFLTPSIISNYIKNTEIELLINIIVCVVCGVIFFAIETPITKFVNRKIYELFSL